MTHARARVTYVVGVDVGGTKVAAVVADSEGKIYSKLKLPTERESVARSVEQIADAAERAIADAALSWDRVRAVGVVIPGVYFAGSGTAWAPNLPGWDHIPLRDLLQTRLPAPAVLDSDRAAYVLGEQWLGIARGLTDVVFLAVGTGIGAGIIANGKLCRGAGDVAGAVGWFALDPGKKAVYQQMGCLEAEAAGPAVARRVAACLASGAASLLQEMAGGALDAITAEMVVAAARRGDPLARRVLDETAAYLGRGVANIISLLNPQMVVLGGGLLQAGELLLAPLRREVFEWAQPLAAQQVRIEPTRLGEDAGVLGAARLALTGRETAAGG